MAANSENKKTTGSKQASRFGKELAFLFGERLIAKSKELSAQAVLLQAEQVADAAGQIKAHRGQPEAQRRIVQGMGEPEAMALCRWLMAAN